MTATDELHRLLGEADIEYKVTSCHLCSSTEWECDLGNAVFYEDHTNGYTRVTIHYKDGMTYFQITSDLKPPERYVTPEQAIAATLGPGTLSASQVSNAVYAHSIHADCADADWQAIADELNAALGPGTCKLTQASWDDDICTWGCICSACDAHLEHETGIGYNFCPICGARVVIE